MSFPCDPEIFFIIRFHAFLSFQNTFQSRPRGQRRERCKGSAVRDLRDSGTLLRDAFYTGVSKGCSQFAVCHERGRIVQYVGKRVC